MPDPRRPLATACVTFYSFKGGVGRSQALINVAALLAGQHAFRVLVLDLDLEAPGLSYLQHPQPSPATASTSATTANPTIPGFIDLLANAKARGGEADLFHPDVTVLRDRYTVPLPIPPALLEQEPTRPAIEHPGSLHLMPAGRLGPDYTRVLNALDIAGLYKDGLGEPLIRCFKQRLIESGLFDFVLIDSRTGFSDEAGIGCRDLADHVVVVSGLNRQNIEGNTQFLRQLRRSTDDLAKRFPDEYVQPTVQVVMSPVPPGEDLRVGERIAFAEHAFAEGWGAELDPPTEIPYHTTLAVSDEPYLFAANRGTLHAAYGELKGALLRAVGWGSLSLWERFKCEAGQRSYDAARITFERLTRMKRHGPAPDPSWFFFHVDLQRDSGLERILEAMETDPAGRPLLERLQRETGLVWPRPAKETHESEGSPEPKAGATGYLLKKTPPAKVLEAIQDLHAGAAPMSAPTARRIVSAFQDPPVSQTVTALLTHREDQILSLLAKGALYGEIATELGISVRTVRTHIVNIYRKLKLRSRTEASLKLHPPGATLPPQASR
jgi:DNA-binding CsgD family transcriptional regulator/cellulose biosynthesis protein BcsQ